MSQEGFRFLNSESNKTQINFKLINNLIVIPLTINGKELNFILDTGVNKTILFNLTKKDSLGLKNVMKVNLQGLGSGEPVEALLSRNNKFQIKNLVSYNETIYVILKDSFDLSGKMGITIHGIIGYRLLKNLVVYINYKNKRINFFKSKDYTYSKCKKCNVIPIKLKRNKPYIDAKMQLDTINNSLTDVSLLIDTGGSDALWLFENSKENIKTPKKYFKDILGEGLSGTIYGNRSRIRKFKLNDFEIENPTVSFLDSISTSNATRFNKTRNGSVGGNILKRFKIWIDYPNKKITLKKNGSFKKGFNYNMSGLSVAYAGKQLVAEEQKTASFNSYGSKPNVSGSSTFDFLTVFNYKFKPAYQIERVLFGSPADLAGLKKGDELLRINGKATHELKLSQIIAKFQEKDNKKIRLTVRRNGQKMKFEFRLKKKV